MEVRPLLAAVLGLGALACQAASASQAERQYLPIGARNASSLATTPWVAPSATITPTFTPTTVGAVPATGTSLAAQTPTVARTTAATNTSVSTQTPLPTQTPSPSHTSTATATPTPTSTSTFTATPLAGTEVAVGQAAFDSDEATGHPAAAAVDARVGGPNGQEDATYWLATGQASFASQRSWSVKLVSAQIVTGVQARLALSGPGRVHVDARLNDDAGVQLLGLTLFDGEAVDSLAIGVALGAPVPGVRDVYLVFTQSPTGVPPGLRTVGVYVQ